MYNETVKWVKKQLNKGSKKRLLIIAAAVILVLLIMAAVVIPMLFSSTIGGKTPSALLPDRVIAQQIDSVSAGGICSLSTNVVKFDKGTQVKSDAVANKAGMNKGSVKFCCSESVSENCKDYVFSEDKGFDCEEDKLEINQEVPSKIRACCPTTEGEPCTIGFKTYKKSLVEQINSAIKNIVKLIVLPVAYLVSKLFSLINGIGFH